MTELTRRCPRCGTADVALTNEGDMRCGVCQMVWNPDKDPTQVWRDRLVKGE